MLSEMAKRFSVPEGSDELAPTRRTLLERLRDLDDQASWQDFFNTYWKLIYRAALKSGLSESEAEDVVQEATIGVARNMGKFRYEPQVCSFKGWLMHITRRRIIDHLRRRQTRPRELLPLPSETETGEAERQLADPAAETAFDRLWNEEWEKNLADAVIDRVKKLVNPEHYQIFYFHSVQNLPARKIAQLMNISTTKVYVVRHRVASLLRREARALARRGAD